MTWPLAAAQANLAEVLRRARGEGPQTIAGEGMEEFAVTIKAAPAPSKRSGIEPFRAVIGLGVDLDQWVGEQPIASHEPRLFADWDDEDSGTPQAAETLP
jgi:prevent-host-death family protein